MRDAETAIRSTERLVRLAQGLGKRIHVLHVTTKEEIAFLAKHKDVVRLLKEGHSVRNAAKITGKGASTVQRVKAALAA